MLKRMHEVSTQTLFCERNNDLSYKESKKRSAASGLPKLLGDEALAFLPLAVVPVDGPHLLLHSVLDLTGQSAVGVCMRTAGRV